MSSTPPGPAAPRPAWDGSASGPQGAPTSPDPTPPTYPQATQTQTTQTQATQTQAMPAQPSQTYPTQPQSMHSHPTPAQPGTPPRRGPGWVGVGAVALAAALLAGLLGGVGGMLLGGALDEDDEAASVEVARPDGSIADIAADAVPSVVTIRMGNGGQAGTGTGWVYDDEGHVVTNNHVVDAAEDDAEIIVETDTGERLTAELVGRDSSYDLAVLKVDDLDRPALPLGRSADVVVGDAVVAVGSPLGLSSSVTSGIVSALERPVTAGQEGEESFISAIQTDAAINPGNSGGPLLDAAGQVVGVNSAIAQLPGQESAAGSIGVGFAIPSDVVGRTVDQLIEDGTAVHPAIGVSLDTRWTGEGARVLKDGEAGSNPVIVTDGPADKAGVEPGDIITEMDGRRLTGPDQLIVQIRAKAVGDTVDLTIRRGDDEKKLTMTLEPAKEQ